MDNNPGSASESNKKLPKRNLENVSTRKRPLRKNYFQDQLKRFGLSEEGPASLSQSQSFASTESPALHQSSSSNMDEKSLGTSTENSGEKIVKEENTPEVPETAESSITKRRHPRRILKDSLTPGDEEMCKKERGKEVDSLTTIVEEKASDFPVASGEDGKRQSSILNFVSLERKRKTHRKKPEVVTHRPEVKSDRLENEQKTQEKTAEDQQERPEVEKEPEIKPNNSKIGMKTPEKPKDGATAAARRPLPFDFIDEKTTRAPREEDDESLPDLPKFDQHAQVSNKTQSTSGGVGKTVKSWETDKLGCFEEKVSSEKGTFLVKRQLVIADVHEEVTHTHRLENVRRKVPGVEFLRLSAQAVNNSLEILCYKSPLKNAASKKAVIDLDGWTSSGDEDDVKKEIKRKKKAPEVVGEDVFDGELSPGDFEDGDWMPPQPQFDLANQEEKAETEIDKIERQDLFRNLESLSPLDLHNEDEAAERESLSDDVFTNDNGSVSQTERIFDCEAESAKESTSTAESNEMSYDEFKIEAQQIEEAENNARMAKIYAQEAEEEQTVQRAGRRRRRASVFGKRRKATKKPASPKDFEVVFDEDRRKEEIKSILRTANRIRRSACRTLVRSKQRKDREGRIDAQKKKVGFAGTPTTVPITPRPEKVVGQFRLPDSPPKTLRALPHLPIDPGDMSTVIEPLPEELPGMDLGELPFTNQQDTTDRSRYSFRQRKPRSSLANVERNRGKQEFLEESEEISVEKEFKKPRTRRRSSLGSELKKETKKEAAGKDGKGKMTHTKEDTEKSISKQVPSMFLGRKRKQKDTETTEDEVIVEKVVKKPKVNLLPPLERAESTSSAKVGDRLLVTTGEQSTNYVSKFFEQEKDRAPFAHLSHVNWEMKSEECPEEMRVNEPWKLGSEEDFEPEKLLWESGMISRLEKQRICGEKWEQIDPEKLNKVLGQIQNECGEFLNPFLVHDQLQKELVENSELPWTAALAPKKSGDFLGNSEAIERLKSWLGRFQNGKKGHGCGLRKTKSGNEKHRKNRRRSRFRLESSTTNSSDSDSDDDDFGRPNPIAVISGPRSSGKTSLVHVVAGELGLKVMEMNCGDFRSGNQIRTEFKGALDSHRVNRGSGQETGSSGVFSLFKKKETDKEDRTKTRGRKPKKMKEEHKLTGENKKHVASLILLDDVDVLFESDEGFWTAVRGFASESMVPVILTCSDKTVERICDEELNGTTHVRFDLSPPPADMAVPYLQVAYLAAKSNLIPESHLRRIYESSGRDLRKVLNNFQISLQSQGVGEIVDLNEGWRNLDDSLTLLEVSRRFEHISIFDNFSTKNKIGNLIEFGRNVRVMDGLSEQRRTFQEQSWEFANFDIENPYPEVHGYSENLRTRDVQLLARTLIPPMKEEKVYESPYYLESNQCLSCDFEAFLRDILHSCKNIVQRRKPLDYFKRIGLDARDELRDLYVEPRFEDVQVSVE